VNSYKRAKSQQVLAVGM